MLPSIGENKNTILDHETVPQALAIKHLVVDHGSLLGYMNNGATDRIQYRHNVKF